MGTTLERANSCTCRAAGDERCQRPETACGIVHEVLRTRRGRDPRFAPPVGTSEQRRRPAFEMDIVIGARWASPFHTDVTKSDCTKAVERSPTLIDPSWPSGSCLAGSPRTSAIKSTGPWIQSRLRTVSVFPKLRKTQNLGPVALIESAIAVGGADLCPADDCADPRSGARQRHPCSALSETWSHSATADCPVCVQQQGYRTAPQ